MNKSELINEIADRTNAEKPDAEAMLSAFQDIVKEVLQNGETLTLVGFGTIKTSERKATTGINPRTKEKIQIPAKTVAKFKFSDSINAMLNK